MSHPTTLQYLDGLRSSRLLDDDRLSELQTLPEATWGDTDALARHAQERGWLSPYQVGELREGRGSQLVVGAYKLVEKLSEHSGYVTYKALHPALPNPVSLRVIRPAWLNPIDRSTEYITRTQAACLVNNPHLTNVLDAGADGDTVFVVQEYADGCDLAQLVGEMGAMPVSLAAEYIRQASLAVQSAHERGVVHGSVSPYTLILTPVKRVVHEATGFVSVRPRPGSVVKLADLGMIPQRPPMGDTTYANTETLGVVEYLPPERMTNPGPEAAGDLYGLGASLYFLLTGRAPYAGSSILDVMLQLQQGEPTPVESLRTDLPPDIVAIIKRCLSRDTLERPSAEEIIAALLPHCEPSAMPAPAGVPAAVPSASETFTQPGIPTASAVPSPHHEPLVEPLPEVHPLDDHHDGENDQFGPSDTPARPRPKVAPKKSLTWVFAGLILHGTAVVLLVCWILGVFSSRPAVPEKTEPHKEKVNDSKPKQKNLKKPNKPTEE
ncbi:serine/threonine protein kinase [Zavarzinella formosa]|uniref:serine/threonine protein kinase n=1 Tax=Zavarzinella formosa TaxID=360055 RepID=UPI0002F9B657|nr:serine/threonine-protein kinase [Zavarzinella formosa]